MNTKKKMGRPTKEVDFDKLDQILRLGGRLKDCEGILDVSHDLIEQHIRKNYNLTFGEYRDLRMATMRVSLLKKQYDIAMKGSVPMLIWLGKQHLGQTEKVEQAQVESFDVNLSKEEELEMINIYQKNIK